MHQSKCFSSPKQWAQASRGFTLIEMMIIIIIVGILMAIAAPAWLRYLENRRVTLARDELHQAIQMAQHRSMTERQSWRFSLRQQGDLLEWAIHPDTQAASTVQDWTPLGNRILLDDPDTTLASAAGIYYVRFGYKGEVIHRLSTVTLASETGLAQNRCAIVSTLLGATRKGKEHPYPNSNGRYCY